MPLRFSYDDLPEEEHIERSIISGLCQSPHMLHKVKETVSQEMFRNDANGIAYMMVTDSLERGDRPDIVIIGSAVGKTIGMNPDYAVDWLRDLTDNTTYHGENADVYANQLLESYRRRELIKACTDAANNAREPLEDVESVLAKLEGKVDGLITGVAKSSVVPVGKSILETLDILGSGGGKYYPTGIETIDQLLRGFKPKQLTILGGRPSMGKSALLLNIAQNLAEAGTATLFSSLEMSTDQLNCRLISRVSGTHLQYVENPQSKREMDRITDAANRILSTPLYIDENAISINEIVSAIRYSVRKEGVKVAFVDYLGLIGPSDERAPREQQVAQITRKLKSLAKEQEISIVLGSQLNRMVESRDDKRPRLADLRESGAAEQDADVVMFVHRPGYYDSNIDSRVAECIVAKQRQGVTGVAKLEWSGETTTFRAPAMYYGDV